MNVDTATQELLAELIRIPSVNPSLDPESEGEGAIADFACDWLRGHGIEAAVEIVEPGRANAVGRLGGGPGPTLALCAHIDTVQTHGMAIEPFEPRVEDGRMFGRGSYDMKGGAAAVMVAAAELARRNRGGPLLVALVCDEEFASIGARHFVSNHPSDACILTEPSEGSLILAHKGFVWAEIVCRGRAAHGSRWDLGVSAIAKMGRVVTALTAFDERELRSRTFDLVGPASMHAAVVRGGTGISTYAPECTLQVERRTLPGESNQEAFDEIAALVHEVDPTAEVRLLLERSPLDTAPDAAIAVATRSAIEDVCGGPVHETGVAYWMDAAIFHAAGSETVNFGPSGAGAHEAEEWVDLASVGDCARVLIEAAERYWAK